jgi:hypothetical protein
MNNDPARVLGVVLGDSSAGQLLIRHIESVILGVESERGKKQKEGKIGQNERRDEG